MINILSIKPGSTQIKLKINKQCVNSLAWTWIKVVASDDDHINSVSTIPKTLQIKFIKYVKTI